MSNKHNFSINDFDKMCRTCSAVCNLHTLHENPTLLVILQSCTQIRYDEHDELPKQICNHCIQQLIQMYNFANKCRMIDNAFRKCLNDKIKQRTVTNQSEATNATMESAEPIRTNHQQSTPDKHTNTTEPVYIKGATSRTLNYKCLSCPKSYNQIKDLKLHMFTHETEKPFKCANCGRGFLKNSLLMHHLRIHTGEKPYKCIECGKTFRHSHSLTVHTRVHTGIKPYRCDYENCAKAFSQISCLIIHKRIHTQERPFRCEVCGKTWITKHKLRVHLRTHTGEKRHVCAVCGKGFTQAVNLRNHGKCHGNKTTNN